MKLAPNLTWLWPDREPISRIDLAARLGYADVEILFPQSLEHQALIAQLNASGSRVVLFDLYPGDWVNGDRGLLCDPERGTEFSQSVVDGLRLASDLGTTRINVLAGNVPLGVGRSEAEQVAIDRLRQLCSVSDQVDFVVEALNSLDAPDYLLRTVDEAASLVYSVGCPRVRLLLDQYHAAMTSAEPLDLLDRFGEITAHVQVSDAPGRKRPGSTSRETLMFLQALQRRGYEGWVGLEFQPGASTDDDLRSLQADLTELGVHIEGTRADTPRGRIIPACG